MRQEPRGKKARPPLGEARVRTRGLWHASACLALLQAWLILGLLPHLAVLVVIFFLYLTKTSRRFCHSQSHESVNRGFFGKFAEHKILIQSWTA